MASCYNVAHIAACFIFMFKYLSAVVILALSVSFSSLASEYPKENKYFTNYNFVCTGSVRVDRLEFRIGKSGLDTVTGGLFGHNDDLGVSFGFVFGFANKIKTHHDYLGGDIDLYPSYLIYSFRYIHYLNESKFAPYFVVNIGECSVRLYKSNDASSSQHADSTHL